MLIGVWTILVPLGRLSRHPLPYSLVLLILTGGILLGIDGTIGPLDWSLEIALPISALIVLGYLLLRFLSKGFSDLGLPLSVALWFLHYRMGWRIDGKKFFDW